MLDSWCAPPKVHYYLANSLWTAKNVSFGFHEPPRTRANTEFAEGPPWPRRSLSELCVEVFGCGRGPRCEAIARVPTQRRRGPRRMRNVGKQTETPVKRSSSFDAWTQRGSSNRNSSDGHVRPIRQCEWV